MGRAKTKFTFAEWWWTNSDENLFELSAEQLYVFRLLVDKAIIDFGW